MQPTLKPQILKMLHQVVERVLELGENQQSLVGAFKEAFLPHDLAKMSEFRLVVRALNCLRLFGQIQEFSDFFTYMLGIAGQSDRLQHPLQALALGILEFLEIFQVGKVRRRHLHQILCVFETILQTLCAVFKRPSHGVRAGSKASLVQRHQETDSPSPWVVALRRGTATLSFHETGDLPIEIEFRAINGEAGRPRDTLSEDRLRGPCSVRLTFREVDHCLLGATQVEGCPPPRHGLANRYHVGVGIPVEQLQEQREVLRITLVRRCSQ